MTKPPPKVGYIYVQKDANAAFASHITVLSESGEILGRVESTRFSEIEGTPGISRSMESLIHQLAWPPAVYSERPLVINHAVLITEDDALAEAYSKTLLPKRILVSRFACSADLANRSTADALSQEGTGRTVVVYAPGRASLARSVQETSERFISELLNIFKLVVNSGSPAKVFTLTNRVSFGEDITVLAQSPLHGPARIIASEHPDNWGGLIDLEDDMFLLTTMKYIQAQDVIRINDGIPRVARLRPLPREKIQSTINHRALMPRPEGTYVITGGLGALGLEIAKFLFENGARRLVLVSRRGLPPRSRWANEPSNVIRKVQELENLGASVHCLSVDIGAADGAARLEEEIDRLNLPRVLGVVHAAGVLESQLVLETTADSFHRVLSPKISGSLALDALYPPNTLDFFILFSSCGQLFGFPGQASYASGNAFLDALATNRRLKGDNSVAFQWTSWRHLGMAAGSDFMSAELEIKGITDITRDEGFRAWQHVDNYDVDRAVVVRSGAFAENETLPSPMLTDIAVRKALDASITNETTPLTASGEAGPKSGPELNSWLDKRIRECVVRVLHLTDIGEVSARTPFSEMGVDSVMTVALRKQLQKSIGVKVPPTLTRSHPTVGHLVHQFAEKMVSDNKAI